MRTPTTPSAPSPAPPTDLQTVDCPGRLTGYEQGQVPFVTRPIVEAAGWSDDREIDGLCYDPTFFERERNMPERWLTLDNYGTLTNWLAGMRSAIRKAGVPDDKVDELLLAYHAQELTIEGLAGWIPYREVLETGLGRAAKLVGVDLPDGGAAAFLEHWDDLPIYDDVAAGLGALRDAGWKLVVLTNCDDDLWARTRAHIPVEFDDWITAEQIKSYKPELKHFQAFRERIADDDLWVHGATSWLHDIYPAARMGVTRVWVDRDLTGHPPAFADRRIPDVASLPAAIEELLPTLRPVSEPHVKSPLQ